jgi:hypothetical protein
MAQRRSIEEEVSRLVNREEGSLAAEKVRALRNALRNGSNVTAAKAARVAGRHGAQDLAPDLVAAFDRFMRNPLKTDKGCMAKIAIVEALNTLEHAATDVLLRGVRHVQMEPAWGPPVDTAANLRVHSAFGLARMSHPGVFYELVSLLMDKQVEARRGAVKAAAYLVSTESELLLRMKALAGDPEPDVTIECLSALAGMAPDGSVEFVTRFVDADDMVIAEGAAIALAESHAPQVFTILREHWGRSINPEYRRMLLLPIALTRNEEAFGFLLETIRTGHRDEAAAAVKALEIYADAESRRKQVYEAVQERGERQVTAVYKEIFAHDTAF